MNYAEEKAEKVRQSECFESILRGEYGLTQSHYKYFAHLLAFNQIKNAVLKQAFGHSILESIETIYCSIDLLSVISISLMLFSKTWVNALHIGSAIQADCRPQQITRVVPFFSNGLIRRTILILKY